MRKVVENLPNELISLNSINKKSIVGFLYRSPLSSNHDVGRGYVVYTGEGLSAVTSNPGSNHPNTYYYANGRYSSVNDIVKSLINDSQAIEVYVFDTWKDLFSWLIED